MTPEENSELNRRDLLRSFGLTATAAAGLGASAGCQFLGSGGVCADSDRFCETWSDGESTGSPAWSVYLQEGDAAFSVRSSESVPRGGPDLLHVHESRGGAASDTSTHAVIGWEQGLEGWDDAWTLSGLFKPTAVGLDPTGEQYHDVLIADTDGFPGVVSPAPLKIGLGFEEGYEDHPSFRIYGPAIDRVISVHDVEWELETWYHWEVSHDGDGLYEGSAWADRHSKPATPWARSRGDVLSGDLAAHIHVDGRGSPLSVAHAFMKWTGP